MHGIYQCKHGVVTKRCRCPNDSVHLVPCPPSCEAQEVEHIHKPAWALLMYPLQYKCECNKIIIQNEHGEWIERLSAVPEG